MKTRTLGFAIGVLLACGEDEAEKSYCEALYECFLDCGSTTQTCEFECAEDPCTAGDNACIQARQTSIDYARAWFDCDDDCGNEERNCKRHNGPYS